MSRPQWTAGEVTVNMSRCEVVERLQFFINGKQYALSNPDPEATLLQFLRKELQLTGTKLGCGEGGCGACTVMVSSCCPGTSALHHWSVNACLTPLCSLHGMAVTTVEGIGSLRTKLHPVQESIAAAHGTQCGFCTPGIVMSMYTLLRNSPTPSAKQIEGAFEGNLCRCTGYRPILDGYRAFSKGCCQEGENCCQNRKETSNENGQSFKSSDEKNGWSQHDASNGNFCQNGLSNGAFSDEASPGDIFGSSNNTKHSLPKNGLTKNGPTRNGPERNGLERNGLERNGLQKVGPEVGGKASQTPLYDPSQEPIFPPYLKLEGRSLNSQSLRFVGSHVTWYRPTSLQQLLGIKRAHPDCKMVIGNTEIGIEVKFKKLQYPVLVAATHVKELTTVERVDSGIKFGASVTLAKLESTMKKAISSLPEWQTRVFSGFVEMLRWFAGQQIRNVAAVGGNIMTASPISDLNPLLLACGAVLELVDTDGKRRNLKMDSTFFKGYRKTAVLPSEIMLNVIIPFSAKNEYFCSYKQATRKEDDISIVNAGTRVVLDPEGKITDLALAFGGMAPITVMATNTMKQMIGWSWNAEMLQRACDLLTLDLPLDPGAPGGMVEYRRTLTLSFFYKFYLTVLKQLQQQGILKDVIFPSSEMSATLPLERGPAEGVQCYEQSPDSQSENDALRQPLVHESAYKQATGEAVYVDDMAPRKGELHLAFVLSQKARAKLVSVDTSAALTMPGVVDFVSHTDIPACKLWGFGQEEVFASNKVVHQGQIIGAILAETQSEAQTAARAVHVEYDVTETPIITIQEAINKESFFPFHPVIKRGDVESAWVTCADHVVQGELHVEAQEHFYLETNTCVAYPGEAEEIEVVAATQAPGLLQQELGPILGVPTNQIVCRTKRLGGGFGGKESRSFIVAIPVAVAAHKHGRPVRCSLDRDEDMVMSGTRHPFFAKYKAGFTEDGKLVAVEMELFSNSGCSPDRSLKVMEKALLASDNCYLIPHVTLKGHCCRTNLPSNTGFRGFGAPQGMLVVETLISHVASRLKMTPEQVREVNLYREGDRTPFNQPMEQCNIRRCWEDCMQQSHFLTRKMQVQEFNSQNRWRKRGIAVVPAKFGISCTAACFNFGGALVNIHADGSVLVCHGGVEMGQGLHTKIIQVASRALDLPASRIRVGETATPTTPNANATAASISSDIYGAAVVNACNELLERLQPVKASHPDASWEKLIATAYTDRINLQATGFYRTPDIGYDVHTNTGKPFAYFTFGAACSEVEIDCLTGDHQVLRTDIVMDVGKSLNPAIDIGQIEGAFMQGYGLMVLEQYKVRPDGTLLTRGPGNYKIPSVGNIPQTFNVTLLRESGNTKAVYSSKGIGEPPILLSASVLFAIREAVTSARVDADLDPHFRLDTPATPHRIRMACGDQFTKKVGDSSAKLGAEPWFVDL